MFFFLKILLREVEVFVFFFLYPKHTFTLCLFNIRHLIHFKKDTNVQKDLCDCKIDARNSPVLAFHITFQQEVDTLHRFIIYIFFLLMLYFAF